MVIGRARRCSNGKSTLPAPAKAGVEPLRLEAGKAGGDGLEALADGVEMVQSLFEAEVGEIVGDQLVAQEGGKLFVLLEEGVLEGGAEDMMAVLDAVDDGGQLAAHPAVQTRAEDLGDLSAVSRHRPSSQPRSKSLWMGKLRLKMKLRQYSIWAIA